MKTRQKPDQKQQNQKTFDEKNTRKGGVNNFTYTPTTPTQEKNDSPQTKKETTLSTEIDADEISKERFEDEGGVVYDDEFGISTKKP